MRSIWTFVRRLLGYGLLFYVLVYVAINAPLIFETFSTYVGEEPSRGTPPYATRRNRALTLSEKIALRRYPTLNSCLVDGTDPPKWGDNPAFEDLRSFRWDDLGTTGKNVCIFRVLAHLGDIDEGARWLASQGLKVYPHGRKFPAEPGIGLSGGLNLRTNGTRTGQRDNWPNVGPYAMTVDTAWSEGGKRLLWVRVGYSSK